MQNLKEVSNSWRVPTYLHHAQAGEVLYCAVLLQVEVGRLCLVLYPPDGVQGNNADNISLTVCGGELCRVVTATVHSKDGVSHLEAKGAHAVEPAAIASCVLNSTLLIGDAEECTTATDYLRYAAEARLQLHQLTHDCTTGTEYCSTVLAVGLCLAVPALFHSDSQQRVAYL